MCFFPGRFKGENFENPAMFEDMFIQFQPEKNGRSASRVLTQGLSPDIIGEIADVLESPWFLAEFLRDIRELCFCSAEKSLPLIPSIQRREVAWHQLLGD